MMTRFFSRYKNYSIQVQVGENKVTCNFTPWGEFGHFSTEDNDLITALCSHPKFISYSEISSWIAPPGKDVVYTDQDPAGMILPPSSENGTIAQPFALTSENLPHFLNNLGVAQFADHTIGVNGINIVLQQNGLTAIPTAITEHAPVGYLCFLPVDFDKYGLIIDIVNNTWIPLVFGVAKARIVGSAYANDTLYNIEESPGQIALSSETNNASQYPLALCLEDPVDGYAKVFFFGGISYPIYTMVSEMIYAALNP